MSVIGVAAGVATLVGVGLTVGSKLYKGGKAGGQENANKLKAMRSGAKDVWEESKELIGRGYDAAVDTADLGLKKAGNLRDFSVQKLGFGARQSVTDLGQNVKSATSKAGFANSNAMSSSFDRGMGTIYDSYEMGQDQAIKGFDIAEAAHATSLDVAGIKKDEGMGDAMAEYQNKLAGIEEKPDDFWEGFWS
tara:strand:+ start:4684 stop:5259 length:576 start_codon:yes stop_codon:yes gene_type:complete